MGTLRVANKDKDPKGAVVNGVTLGEPAWSAYNADGTPAPGAVEVFDDPRIPSGEVESVKDKGGKDKPQPHPRAVKHGDVWITPDQSEV